MTARRCIYPLPELIKIWFVGLQACIRAAKDALVLFLASNDSTDLVRWLLREPIDVETADRMAELLCIELLGRTSVLHLASMRSKAWSHVRLLYFTSPAFDRPGAVGGIDSGCTRILREWSACFRFLCISDKKVMETIGNGVNGQNGLIAEFFSSRAFGS